MRRCGSLLATIAHGCGCIFRRRQAAILARTKRPSHCFVAPSNSTAISHSRISFSPPPWRISVGSMKRGPRPKPRLALDPTFTIRRFRAGRAKRQSGFLEADASGSSKACVRPGSRRDERDPENCGDPRRRRRRLQPARGSGRGSHAGAASRAAQRPHRPDDRGPPRPRLQAHRRRAHRRVPQRGRRGALRDRNAERHGRAQRGRRAEKRIELRIGVHLGDVVEEADGDLMGDGVNIAARLESIAEPGGFAYPRTPTVRFATG